MSQTQPADPVPTSSGASKPAPSPWGKWLVLLVLLVGTWIWQSRFRDEVHPEVDYSTLVAWIRDDKVTSLVIEDQVVQGQLKNPEKVGDREVTEFHAGIPSNDPQLMQLLHEKKVGIRIKTGGDALIHIIASFMPWLVIFGVWWWLGRQAKQMTLSGGPFSGILKGRGRKFEKTAAPSVTFDDVAGLKSAKQDLQEIVHFLKEPEHFRRLGGKIPRGVLLVGPPGTGKTLLARAVAGESGVPFYSISASEFIELFVGVGAARVRELFDEAKKNAPAIVFIDEIDAVGRSRGTGFGGGHDEREQTLNQLLSEMDGFNRNDLTVVLAATNRPDVLDPALLRPGRFDRRVVVDRPEAAARKAILDVHVKGKPLAADVQIQSIADNTPGFSGADLANLVNEAALAATRRGGDAIQASDFSAAFDKIVLGDPREAKLAPAEKRRVAVHEAGHAIVALFSPEAEPVHRVSVIPRGMALGATQQTPLADRHLMTQSELQTRLCVLMAGYASERLVLGDISNGAENDLKEATRLASQMVAHYGMSQQLGPVYYDVEAEHPFLGQRLAMESFTSDRTSEMIEREARGLLTAAVDGAAQLLKEHRTVLDRLIVLLLEKETVERDDLELLARSPAESSPAKAAETALARSDQVH